MGAALRTIGWVIALICAAPFAANADVATAPTAGTTQQQTIPHSIWRLDDHNDATHVQTGLVCPASSGNFKRIEMRFYKASGLDISCNYRDADKTLITIYLTRRGTQSVADDFTEAKRELVQVQPAARPLSDAEQKTFAPDLKWLTLLYSEQGGQVHSGIWIADFHGWTLEYRATYATDNEASALTEMAALTDAALNTAGKILATCEKSGVPERSGALIVDKDKTEQALVLASLLGKVTPDKDTGAQTAPRAVTWCPESEIGPPDYRMLLWHAAFEDGSDASADRVTPEILEDPPALEAKPDRFESIVEGEIKGGKENNWTASVNDGKTTWLFGLFSGRPAGDALGTLMFDIMHGKAKAIGGYSADGKNISISLPPENR
jgi:hypothetical protein